MNDFSQEQIRVVASAYLLGTSHFDEDHPQSDVLGQLFCYAVRDVLTAELQGTGTNHKEVLWALAEEAQPQVLPETYRAFAELSEEEFAELLTAVLEVADQSQLTRQELIDGLSSVNDIVDYFASETADGEEPA